MSIENDPEAEQIMGRVLVVDDNAATRTLHRALLAKQFEVVTAGSGEEAIELCKAQEPDLVVLDIEMPDMDGIQTCRKLREWSQVPVIFATGHESLDEHLRAYDAGGNDIVTKPVHSEILLRKAALVIRQHRASAELVEEHQSLHKMAMEFLSSVGQSGALLNFMRASVACRSHQELGQRLFETAGDLGMACSVMLRHRDGPTYITPHGDATPIEKAIFEQSAAMGRCFQFGQRLAVNYDRVSIIVANMPDEETEPDLAGRTRDNIAILAETTEALCDNVDMRMESVERAEQLQVTWGRMVTTVESLRQKYLQMMGDTRILLQELVDKVERSFGWLGASESQEVQMSNELDQSIQSVLALLAEGGDFDREFSKVLESLKNKDESSAEDSDIELF